MCQYVSQPEGQCSQTMKQTTKEPFNNNMHHHDTMKTISKAFLSNWECSMHKPVCYILSKLNLRRVFPVMYFLNRNLLKETFWDLPF